MTSKTRRWAAALAALAVIGGLAGCGSAAASGSSTSTPPAASQPAARLGSPADWWAKVGGPDMTRTQDAYINAVRQADPASAAPLLTDAATTATNDVLAEYVAAQWASDPTTEAFYQHYIYAATQYRSIGVALSEGRLPSLGGNYIDVSGQVQLAHDAAAQAKAEAQADR